MTTIYGFLNSGNSIDKIEDLSKNAILNAYIQKILNVFFDCWTMFNGTRGHLLGAFFCFINLVMTFSLFPIYGEPEIPYNNSFDSDSNLIHFTSASNNSALEQVTSISVKENKSSVEKAVIILFDRGYKNQFIVAKPILDKYGFKASFFIICSFINGQGYYKLSNGSELAHKGDNAMDWDHVKQLYKEGHDIESHGMQHRDLRLLSPEKLEHEIAESKECLQDYGLKPTFFQIPNNRGADNTTVLKMVSKYFDFALSGHSRLMFLNCDGWVNHGFKTQSYKYQYDCNPYSDDGTPTRTHKLAIREWSHDREHSKLNNKNPELPPHGAQISELLFTEFVRVVEAQTIYNINAGKIVSIPIIGYHFIGNSTSYDTSIELFDREMKYLRDNGFKVLILSDLGYNDKEHYFYIK